MKKGTSEMQQGEKTQFEKGVHYIIGTWTLVELAISHGFGGRQTARKVELMEGDLLQLFYKGKNVGVDEIEDFLYAFLAEKLNTSAEDGSVEEIADEVMDLFETCQKGDFTGVEELRKLYEKKNPPDRPPRVPQRMEIDDDDEDGEGSSESEEETEGGNEESKENGEKEENTGSRRKGQVDEDGWEVVTHKGRGRNAK